MADKALGIVQENLFNQTAAEFLERLEPEELRRLLGQSTKDEREINLSQHPPHKEIR